MPEAALPERPTDVAASLGHDGRPPRVFATGDRRRILAGAEPCTERWRLRAPLRRERRYSARLAATQLADKPGGC
jgi:hypothetical protein